MNSIVTLNDFNAICRICLQSSGDMIDIFRTGVDNQLMEITKLKVTMDDKLPKTLCCSCRIEIDCLVKFLEKAKSSDLFLRSLLTTDKIENDDKKSIELNNYDGIVQKTRQPPINVKSKKRKKERLENSKIYVIVVPKNDGNLEEENIIYIKDLSVNNDSSEYFRTLVKNYFLNQVHSEKMEFCRTSNNLTPVKDCKNTVIIGMTEHKNFIYKVNLLIFKCDLCSSSFEEYCELSNHYLSVHNILKPILQFNYFCPVCEYKNNNKIIFFEHLQNHKAGGFIFIKSNDTGDAVTLNHCEKDLFFNLISENDNSSKLLLLNMDSFTCMVCSDKIEYSALANHMNLHQIDTNPLDGYYIRYRCFECSMVFINDKKQFIDHIISHKQDNLYFINVNSAGHILEENEDKELYIPYREALAIKKIYCKSNKIFQITNINSCNKCDYEADSFHMLTNHYEESHSEKLSKKVLFSCPVCCCQYDSDELQENEMKLYNHLRVHRNSGDYFIKINNNGSISNCSEEYADIFLQSKLFLSFLNNSLIADFDQIWCPELVISNSDGAEANYQCEICRKQFRKKKEIIKHLKSHQKKEIGQLDSNYICEKCGKNFLGKENYEKHFSKHDRVLNSVGRKPICPVCRKTFANKTSLCQHMRHHVKEGFPDLDISLSGIICEKCGKSFSNNNSLSKHKKIHTAGKENAQMKCEFCDREFFRQTSFERHKSAHLNPRYFDCDVCKLPLSSAISLQKHAELHKFSSNTFDCNTCKTSFLTKESLTAHQAHTGHYLDRKPLECNVCHEKFLIGKKFTEHIKNHPKYKMGKCNLCGKRLSTVQSLMLHMGRHFQSNTILCPHCGKQFLEERNYHRHLLTHKGIKPYSCDVEGCQKSFYTFFELNRHKKYHNNTRDFGCPYCAKCFHEANHLTVHIRTHTGERPYICPHCSKGFITRTRCKHHIKLVHQGIGYDLIQSSISKKVAVFETVERMA